MTLPNWSPVAGVTTLGDVETALIIASEHVHEGGDPLDPRYLAYVDKWLDYRLTLADAPVEVEA